MTLCAANLLLNFCEVSLIIEVDSTSRRLVGCPPVRMDILYMIVGQILTTTA